MTLPMPTSVISLADFLLLPETKPASEYINGRIYQKPMPQGKHSILQARLVAAINQIAIPNQLAYGFTELRCTFGDRAIVPDVSVFQWQRLPLDDNGEIANSFAIAPDWIIEILSPEQSTARLIDKIIFCGDRGTSIGWLVDPSERLVIIFRPNRQPETKEGSAQLPGLDMLKDWELTANDLFAWLSLTSEK